MIEIILLLIVTTLLLVLVYTKKELSYWNRKGVPSFNPLTPAGDLLKTFLGIRCQHALVRDCYEAFRAMGHKFGGIYFTLGPIFFPVDVQLIKQILQTDFEYFHDRGMYCDKKEQPLSNHIFSLPGETWKNRRQKIMPSLSSGKLKMMFPVVMGYGKTMVEVVKSQPDKAISVTNLFRRYTLDVVLNCFFGLEESNLTKRHTVYMDMADKITHASVKDLIKAAWTSGTRNPGNLIKIVFMDPAIYIFWRNVINKIVAYRQKNKVRRDDVLDYLLALVKEDVKKNLEQRPGELLDLDDILADLMAFFAGGFETTSFTLSCCLFEISKNQAIQEKLRKEINTALSNTKEPTYAILSDLKYMDQVLMETMRKHTVFSTLNRICVKDYLVPDTGVVIEKDTPVMISSWGYHNDPEYFPEPEKFDPNRFSNEATSPYMIAFGGGPRYCVGRRFAEVQMKVALMELVKNFKLTLDPTTGEKLEVDNVTRHVVLQYKNDIKVYFTPI